MNLALRLLIIMLLPALAQAQSMLKPYTARYAVKYKGITGGDIEFSLKSEGEGRYVYRSQLLPNLLGSLFTSDQAIDTTHVLVTDGRVQPLAFQSEDGSKNSLKDIRYDFDWQQRQVRGRYKDMDFELALPANAQDRLSIQLAASLLLQAGKDPGSMTMLERRDFNEYQVTKQRLETVKVPAGEFDTVVLSSSRKDSQRTMLYWYSAKLGYLPVRAERSTDGKPDILMELKSIQFPIQ